MTGTMSTDLVDPRVEREARWCYERRIERMTMREIATLAGRHPDDGGLGVAMSPPTVMRRVRTYHALMLEVESETRDEARAREVEVLDRAARDAADLIGPIDIAATRKRQAQAVAEGLDPNDPGCIVMRDEAVRLRAIKLLVEVGAERRKLLGLDAPTETHVDLTITDAATAELNAMLAEAGLAPIETEARP